MKLYNGREYKWWIIRNDHVCRFCNIKGIDYHFPTTRTWQGQKGYWGELANLFRKHVRECHPEVEVTNA